MINYLFSGIDKEKGFNEKQSEYLKKDIKNNSNIVFIASTFNNYEKNDTYKNKMIEFFKNIGIEFSKLLLLDNRVSADDAHKSLKETDIVFLLGGDVFSQMNSINEYNLKEDIKKVKIVLGVSAGSLNQSKNVIYLDEYQDNKLIKYEGLGLINFNIYPHFVWDNINYLKEVFEVSTCTPLIVLPNDSFIRVENNNIEYVGEYNIVDNKKINIEGYPYEKINHVGSIDLESERLLFRKTTIEDIDEFFYIQLNPNVRKLLGPNKVGNDYEKNRKFFDETKYNELDYYRWTIVRKEDNKLLGTIYLNIHSEKARTAGIDYWIREDEWGKGYTTEASKCILEFAFNTLNLNRIESSGAKDNVGTWKVMEHIGLKYEGVRKESAFYYYGGVQDLVMYGITKEEYLNNKNM